MNEIHPENQADEAMDQLLQGYFAQSKAELDDELPLSRLLSQVSEVYEPAPGPVHRAWQALSTRWVGSAVGLCAAAACAWMMFPRTGLTPHSSSLPDAGYARADAGYAHPSWLHKRGSGASALLRIFLKSGQQVRALRSGERVRRGDKLRVVVAWKKGGRVTLVHSDAKGTWTPLYPRHSRSQRGVLLTSSSKRSLPGSLEITEQPQGNEILWACFSSRGLSHRELLPLLKQKKPTACEHLERFVLGRPQR